MSTTIIDTSPHLIVQRDNDVVGVQAKDPDLVVAKEDNFVEVFAPESLDLYTKSTTNNNPYFNEETNTITYGGLVGIRSFGLVELSWIELGVPAHHRHTNIYRAERDDISFATCVGDSRTQAFSDSIKPGSSYYYWLKGESYRGNESAPSESIYVSALSDLTDVQSVLGISGLINGLATLTTDLTNLINEAESDLNAEIIAKYNDLVGTITGNMITINGALLDLQVNVNAANAATLAELSDRLDLTISNLNAEIIRINNLRAELNTETAERKAEITRLDQVTVGLDEAIALLSVTLNARIDTEVATLNARITSEMSARVTEEQARVEAILLLQTEFDRLGVDTNAKLIQQNIAISTVNGSLTQAITLLETDFSNQFVYTNARITDETLARSTAYESLASQIVNLDTKFVDDLEIFRTEVEDSIVTFSTDYQAYSSQLTSLISSYEHLETTVTANAYNFTESLVGYCTLDGAITDAVNKQECEAALGTWELLPLSTAIEKVSVSITDPDGNVISGSSGTLFQTLIDDLGNVEARAWLGVDVNGRITGINVQATDGSVSTSTIDFIADRINFLNPTTLDPVFYFDTQNSRAVFEGQLILTDGTIINGQNDLVDAANAGSGPINWRGEFSEPPANPQENWAYRDTDDGKVYIYNGSSWVVMVDAAQGEPGSGIYALINATGQFPSDAIATSEFIALTGRNPTDFDILTYVNADNSASETKRYNASTGEWVTADFVFNGELITKGTITADKINVYDLFAQDITASGTITGATINAGTFTGGDISGTTLTSTTISATDITGGTITSAALSAIDLTSSTISATDIIGGNITGARITAVNNTNSVVIDPGAASPFTVNQGNTKVLRFDSEDKLILSGGLGPETIGDPSVFTQALWDQIRNGNIIGSAAPVGSITVGGEFTGPNANSSLNAISTIVMTKTNAAPNTTTATLSFRFNFDKITFSAVTAPVWKLTVKSKTRAEGGTYGGQSTIINERTYTGITVTPGGGDPNEANLEINLNEDITIPGLVLGGDCELEVKLSYHSGIAGIGILSNVAVLQAVEVIDGGTIDADTFDGLASSEFYKKTDDIPWSALIGIPADLGGGGDADTLDGLDSTDFYKKTDNVPWSAITSAPAFITGVNWSEIGGTPPSSVIVGLNADKLDSLSSADFARREARTDGYVWVRRNTGASVLYATNQGSGDIARFLSGAGDGTEKCSIMNDGSVDSLGAGFFAGNNVRISGGSPRVELKEGTKSWFLIQDGGAFSIRETTTSAQRFKIDVGGHVRCYDDLTVSDNIYANGTRYYGDNKAIIKFDDSWLRLNPDNQFSNGIFCGSSILRTDGQLQVGSGGTKFNVTSTGTVTASGNVTAADCIATSDRRVKDDLKRIENALDKVCNLTGYTFWRKDTEQYAAGIIAQDLQAQLPEGVTESDDGILHVSSQAEIGLLVEAIKEIRTELNYLSSKVH